MAVHVEDLICNVTVTRDAPPLDLARPVDTAGEVEPEPLPERPALEQVLASPGKRLAERAAASAAAPTPRALGGAEPAVEGVDPRALADRVYRLMHEELEIALERE